MTSIADIGIRVESPAADAGVGGVEPILTEIANLLARLVERGEGGAIDLRGLPLSPSEHETLRASLGDGEVRVTIESLGPTTVRETACHGVWWVKHASADGATTAEFIEVSYVPEILKTHPADAKVSLEQLQEVLMNGCSRSTER